MSQQQQGLLKKANVGARHAENKSGEAVSRRIPGWWSRKAEKLVASRRRILGRSEARVFEEADKDSNAQGLKDQVKMNAKTF